MPRPDRTMVAALGNIRALGRGSQALLSAGRFLEKQHKGKKGWVPTVGKAPYLMFRFYGPEETFCNKTFKPADVERVE